jgi:hypothetical protein
MAAGQHRPAANPLIPPGSARVGHFARLRGHRAFVLLHVARAIAQGEAVLGREVRQCPVVYVAAEGGTGLPKRILAHRQRYGAAPSFHYIAQRVDLHDPNADLSALIEAAQAIGAGLIVLDTSPGSGRVLAARTGVLEAPAVTGRPRVTLTRPGGPLGRPERLLGRSVPRVAAVYVLLRNRRGGAGCPPRQPGEENSLREEKGKKTGPPGSAGPAGFFAPTPTQLRGMADRDTMKPVPPQGDDPAKPQPKPGPPPQPQDDLAKPQPKPVQDRAADRPKESANTP